MGMGKPVIVSSGEETARYPEMACLRVDSGPAEEEMLAAYMLSLRHLPRLGMEIGRRAAEHIKPLARRRPSSRAVLGNIVRFPPILILCCCAAFGRRDVASADREAAQCARCHARRCAAFHECFSAGCQESLPNHTDSHSYGKGSDLLASYQTFVDHGYTVVLQDVRGRYDSEGVFNALTQEGKDGSDTLDWIAGAAMVGRQSRNDRRIVRGDCAVEGGADEQSASEGDFARWFPAPTIIATVSIQPAAR